MVIFHCYVSSPEGSYHLAYLFFGCHKEAQLCRSALNLKAVVAPCLERMINLNLAEPGLGGPP